MVCSTSIRWHLARGLAALACAGVALRVGADRPFVAIAGILSAMFFLRGCPICWLLGLVDRIRTRTLHIDRQEGTQP